MTTSKTKVLLILGSMRAGSFTAKVGSLVKTSLEQAGYDVDVLDPRVTDLSFPGESDHDQFAAALRARATSCAGGVLVTPEYDGSISSIMKLIVEHLGYPSSLAGKPVSLVGCAGGRLGAVKSLEHLRSIMSSTGAVVLPASLSISFVHQAFGPSGELINPQLRQDIEALVTAFHQFPKS